MKFVIAKVCFCSSCINKENFNSWTFRCPSVRPSSTGDGRRFSSFTVRRAWHCPSTNFACSPRRGSPARGLQKQAPTRKFCSTIKWRVVK